MSAQPNLHDIAAQPWPEAGLERLDRCPVCGEKDRSVLHSDLWDSGFFAAPGLWSMWRCAGCGSGYLDPRPNAATIGLAYSNYYTHQRREAADRPKSLRAALGNGYRNARYGTALEPSLAAGKLVGLAFPRFRQAVDAKYRYLPRARGSAQRKVLDIGCGSGEWLLVAREAGWLPMGSDPDPLARAAAAEVGVEVRQGGAEAWEDQLGTFDAVSMSHVIEHVHDPLETFRSVFELLRPGGQLFLESPNVDALGHSLFGPNWCGLEAPRHLVLFNRRSLTDALRNQGFVHVRHRRPPPVFHELSMRSARIAAGRGDGGWEPDSPVPRRLDRIRSAFARGRAEYLTVTCEKPTQDSR